MTTAAGCSTSAANVANVDTESGQSDVLIGDEDLYDDLKIQDIKTRNAETSGFLEVQATLVNLDDDTIRFEYEFEWFDESGFELQSHTEHWNPKIIYGHQRLPIKGTAPDGRAKSFKLAVRRPQEVK